MMSLLDLALPLDREALLVLLSFPRAASTQVVARCIQKVDIMNENLRGSWLGWAGGITDANVHNILTVVGDSSAAILKESVGCDGLQRRTEYSMITPAVQVEAGMSTATALEANLADPVG